MKKTDYIRTDLAAECPAIEKKTDLPGISVSKETIKDIEITTVRVLTPEGEQQIGKPAGTYITVNFGKIWLLSDDEYTAVVQTVSDKLAELASTFLNNKKIYNILIVGLGNRFITSDAVGPLSVEGITVTSHICARDKNLFKMLGKQSISAFSPGVIGQTGIETCDLILGAVKSVKPDLLIAIDALASKSVDRLATTVQICDTGIAPGSGIGNRVKAVNKHTLGVPVIAIGVPTMVNSSTLVYDALEKAGIENICDELVNILENGKSFFVTLNENDTVINSLSTLVSDSINTAFSAD